MARQRKIKRYNYGSLSMRRRRGRWLKVLLFILLQRAVVSGSERKKKV